MSTAPVQNYVNTFRIGCDPEFTVIDKDGFRPRPRGLPGDCVGEDCSAIELRPPPRYTVRELLGEIKTLLKHPSLNQYKDYKWFGGAFMEAKYKRNDYGEGDVGHEVMGFAGHVHLELPYDGYHNLPKSEFQKRIRGLDRVIQFLEETNILPQEECRLRRDRAQWGAFGAVKASNREDITPLTDIKRMEYRTPCSWLFDPRAAYITITGVKLAAASPDTALNVLSETITDKHERFRALFKFFRAFKEVDSDARYVCENIIRSSYVGNLTRLQASTSQDFREKWEKFKG